MADAASALQPAIDMLEGDLAELERQANGLLVSINLLRKRAGMPPRQSGFGQPGAESGGASGGSKIKLHSDTFTGKKLSAAVREYLDMRKKAGGDAPATSREIFDALKEGGFASGAKDNATALIVLRTMLRKNTTTFAKLQNGKFGLRSWYPNFKPSKAASQSEAVEADGESDPDEANDTRPGADGNEAEAA
jgi:hypothetical protein